MGEAISCRVYLSLMGLDFDVRDVEARIGVQPHKRVFPGSFTRIGRPMYARLEYSSREVVDDVVMFGELAAEALAPLIPKVDLISEIVEECGLSPVLCAVLWYSVNSEYPSPCLSLGAKQMSFMGRIGGELDIDAYWY